MPTLVPPLCRPSAPVAPLFQRRLAPCRPPHSVDSAAGAPSQPIRWRDLSLSDKLMLLFPLWTFVGAWVAYRHPWTLGFMTRGGGTARFNASIGLLMLSMGLSLSKEDFAQCARRPGLILAGFAAQYGIMPLLGLAIAKALRLPTSLAVGFILLSCCPGGQVANVAALVGHGDVALSVVQVALSTLSASIMTPLLTSWLAGQFVPVSARALAVSTAKLVLAPTVLGVGLNELCPALVARLRPAMPLVALSLSILAISTPVAQVQPVLAAHGASVLLPVALLHFGGYALGYLLPKLLGARERPARTISFQTGMQSAALGYGLSVRHFSDPRVAVPSALAIVVMVAIGTALAAVFRFLPIRDEPRAKRGFS